MCVEMTAGMTLIVGAAIRAYGVVGGLRLPRRLGAPPKKLEQPFRHDVGYNCFGKNMLR